MNPTPARWRSIAIQGIVWAILAWATLIYIQLLRSNLVLLHSATHPLGVFSAALGPYTFSLENTPPLELLQAVVALGLVHTFGLLVLAALRLCPPGWKLHALAYTIGFGLSGLAIELLTMARLLYTPTIWLLWIALLGGAFWLARSSLPQLRRALLPTRLGASLGTLPERCLYMAMLLLVGIITLTNFWHALLYPETYWDSLILYFGYGRMTFLQHGFPFKAEAQVGIGLGANYPHLFSTYGASASMLFGHWSDLHLRLAAPMAGLATTILVYAAAQALCRNRVAAMAATLLFRALPYGIAYNQWASDYAFAILFVATFVYTGWLFIQVPNARRLMLFTMVPAISMHLNYLMGILWPAWGLLVFWVQARIHGRHVLVAAIFRANAWVWGILAIGLLLASPWYIRNTVLTGNPVYAFFPEVFTASVRVNPEVLRSAELEWFRVGDGIGKPAEIVRDYRLAETGFDDPAFQRSATFADRLRASFVFWVGFDIYRPSLQPSGLIRLDPEGWLPRIAYILDIAPILRALDPELRLLNNPGAYKMQPMVPAFFLPLVIAGPVLVLLRGRLGAPRVILFALAGFVSLSLLAYMYLLADFYLYQIIGGISSMAVAVALLPAAARSRVYTYAFAAFAIVQGVMPGIAFGLLGVKFTGSEVVYGQQYNQLNLDAWRNPGMPAPLFMRLRYGRDPEMWEFVNENLRGERLLTHENRHYVYDPSITLVHLDDWAMQAGYDKIEPAAIAAFLRGQGLRHYLRIPNEASHTINRRLGMDLLLRAGYLREIRRAGDNVLYEILEAPQPSTQ